MIDLSFKVSFALQLLLTHFILTHAFLYKNLIDIDMNMISLHSVTLYGGKSCNEEKPACHERVIVHMLLRFNFWCL